MSSQLVEGPHRHIVVQAYKGVDMCAGCKEVSDRFNARVLVELPVEDKRLVKGNRFRSESLTKSFFPLPRIVMALRTRHERKMPASMGVNEMVYEFAYRVRAFDRYEGYAVKRKGDRNGRKPCVRYKPGYGFRTFEISDSVRKHDECVEVIRRGQPVRDIHCRVAGFGGVEAVAEKTNRRRSPFMGLAQEAPPDSSLERVFDKADKDPDPRRSI